MPSSDPLRSTANGALLVDLYELTMAQLYFDEAIHETPAMFEHFFRSYPDYGTHQAGYCIQAGLEGVLDWIEQHRFDPAALDYLRGLTDRSTGPLFTDPFLEWLEAMSFADLRLWSIPEGRVVHAGVTLSIITGPLAVAQILETAILNQFSYQTLIATKASLVAESARGRPTLEFGVRRGPQFGAAAGTRAALIGGASSTSYVGAAMLAGVQPTGTHGHSMVQAMMALGKGELGAFQAYARSFPDSCLLLVDTVDTLASGLPNAVAVFTELRDQGHEPIGIRLDSGDLAHLAIRSAQQLNAAGFTDQTIVLSSGLDELAIWQILTQIEQEAAEYGVEADHLIDRLAFGVGTKLLTSDGDPSLDSVYKLVAVERDGSWVPAVKISESPQKTVTPGHKQVVRLYDQRGLAAADVLGLEGEDIAGADHLVLRHPIRHDFHRTVDRTDIERVEPLLEPAWIDGKRMIEPEPIDQPRARREADMSRLDPGVRRLMNPHVYHVSLTQALWELKQETVESAGDRTPHRNGGIA
ncbi:MAG: nicotinate phosphoribosyltransferase [Acidimicrobiia bacterium]